MTAPAIDEKECGPTGRETILLAEDDEASRDLWGEVLESLGYRTLVASNGVEALESAAAHEGSIDLLISDVMMPKLGGCELAAQLRERRPGLRVILMSGCTAHTPLRRGIAESGSPFLQKPFSAHLLARKIRETLDGGPLGSSKAP